MDKNIKDHINLVNPANKRNIDIIVVEGLQEALASSYPVELGYNVKAFAHQDSPPRRAHSIAAQGGINAKTRWGWRLQLSPFLGDTVKGGDYRAREANVYRLK